MPYIFRSGESITDTLLDELIGGAAGFAGRYTYSKVIGKPLIGLLGSLGKYADVGGSYLFGLLLSYIGGHYGGNEMLSKALQIAGYVPFADALGRLAGDPAPVPTGAVTPGRTGNPWGSLTPVPLGRGSGGTLSVR